jgi:gamma-glutamyl:cysteine ligase YbdK (ATP-grasp superfamily)
MSARRFSEVSQSSDAAQVAGLFAENIRPDIRPDPHCYKRRRLRVRDAHLAVADVLCAAAVGR